MTKLGLSVGFVVSHPFHGSPGSIIRVKELSRSLSNFGVTIHIYSPFISDESWGSNIYFHKLPSLCSTFGLKEAMYCLTRKVLNNRFLLTHFLSQKMLDKTINNLTKSLNETITSDIDIIQGEQEIAAAACVRAKEKLGIPVVTSLHNIWPEELVAMNLIDETSEQYTFLQELEREIVTESNFVVAVSEGMASYLKDKFSPNPDRITVIPPGGRAKMRNVCDRFAPFKVVYAGLVVQRAQIDLFIKSMPIILKKYPETKFYITNQGEELNKMKRLAKELGVNPEFYWFENSLEFYNFLATCHVGVVTSSNDLPRRIGPAVKLFDYLSVGLPVVANEIGGWTKVIKDEQVGLLTKCDPESFAQGIIKLLDNPDLSRRYGNMGLKLVNTKMNWDTSASALVNKYEQSLEKTPQDTIKLTTMINNNYLHAT